MRSALLLPVIVHAHSIRVVLTVVYSARMFGERKREREILFLEKGKKVTRVKLNMRRRMFGVIGEFWFY